MSKIKISNNYREKFKIKDIYNIIEILQNREPDFLREKERRKIWELNYNNMDIYVKNFSYSNFFIKYIKHYGMKNYRIAHFFIENGIKTPEPIFYFSVNNEEYFGTLKIDNCINLWDFLSTDRENEPHYDIVKKLNNMLDLFKKLNIYHSDFNVKNLIVNNKTKELFILDLEAVRFNCNRRRMERMRKKINKYIKNFNIEV